MWRGTQKTNANGKLSKKLGDAIGKPAKRSGIEWIGWGLIMAAECIPWLAIVIAFLFGFLCGLFAYDSQPLTRIQW